MTTRTVRTATRRARATVALGFVATAAVAVATISSAPAAAGATATAARAISVREEAALRKTSESGNTLQEYGSVTGTLRGTATASISTSGTFVHVTAVLHVSGGTITVSGEGQLNANHGTEVSFKAPGRVTKGSGAFAHASGKGIVYGSENRSTHNVKIQVVGKLNY